MKKILIALALSSTGAVFAANPTAFLTYDIDGGAHEVKATIAQPTPYGSVDANVLVTRSRTGAPHTNGFEVGYGNGLNLGRFGLRARLAYGDTFAGNSSYYWVGAETAFPVTQRINAFVAARHLGSLNSIAQSNNQFTLGADIGISKTFAVRAGIYQKRFSGLNRTGFTTSVFYNF